jgi:hypothetical protein
MGSVDQCTSDCEEPVHPAFECAVEHCDPIESCFSFGDCFVYCVGSTM